MCAMTELICRSPKDGVLVAPEVKPFRCPGVKKGRKYKVLVDFPLMRSSDGELRVLTYESVKRVSPFESEGVYIRRKSETTFSDHCVLTATLCSQSKYQIEKAKPAELWDSSRIRRYLKYCKEFELPASILSWKYGVVPEEVEVFNYDEFSADDPDHWVEVLKGAQERYGIEKLYAWFDPTRGLPVKIQRALEQVFPEAGATTHLIHLNRFVNFRRREIVTWLGDPDFVSLCLTVLPRASRLIEIGSADGTFTFALKTWKRCQVLAVDPNPWSYYMLRASFGTGNLNRPKKNVKGIFYQKSSSLGWLDGWFSTNLYTRGLLIRSLLILTNGSPTLTNLKKVNPDECLSLVRKLSKTLRASARITPKPWSLKRVTQEIREGDIILIRYFNHPSSWDTLNLFFKRETLIPDNDLEPKDFFRELAKRLASNVFLWYPHTTRGLTYNKVSKALKNYFSQTSLLSLKGYDLILAR